MRLAIRYDEAQFEKRTQLLAEQPDADADAWIRGAAYVAWLSREMYCIDAVDVESPDGEVLYTMLDDEVQDYAVVAQHTRDKLAAIAGRCDPGCPGWAIFETDRGLDPEVCDECNEGRNNVVDFDLDLLPEVQLALAVERTRAAGFLPAGFPSGREIIRAMRK